MLKIRMTTMIVGVIAALLLYSFHYTAHADVIENQKYFKGLRVESPRPKGYTSIKTTKPNSVFQWGKEAEKGAILLIQLSIYEVPDKEPNPFIKIDPQNWASHLVPRGTGHVLSAVETRKNDTRAIDVVYDHILNVEEQRWRSLNFTRSFFVSKRLVVVECISSILQGYGNAPTISNLAELRSKHEPDCNYVLEGLRVESAQATQ